MDEYSAAFTQRSQLQGKISHRSFETDRTLKLKKTKNSNIVFLTRGFSKVSEKSAATGPGCLLTGPVARPEEMQ